MQANGRRRKNFIQSLKTGDSTLFSHHDKAEAVFQHYSSLFGPPSPRETTLNWEHLQLQRHELAHLEDPFTEEEVHAVIGEIAADKAPGPDGFIGLFLKRSWPIIKNDIMAALEFFHQQHDQHLLHLNKAHMILLPKKEDAQAIGDFRPISLTHSIAKLISKILATRLSGEFNGLISRAQSTFIKRRSIHDNFLYAQRVA